MAADRQKLLDKAERLASRGKLNAAINEFLKVIDAHPDDTSTLNRVGDMYVRLKRVDDAIELFRQAAESFEHQGFFVKAIAIYKKILRIDTSQLEVSECLADLQHRQGLLPDARRQYEAVADNYQTRGDLESAIAVRRKLIDVDPEDPGHRLTLAELLKGENRIPEAMGQYKGIADLFVSRGLLDDAIKVCLQALALAPQNTDFIAGVARGLNAAGHLEHAEQFLEAATEHNPEAARISLQPIVGEAEQEPRIEAEARPEKVAEEDEASKGAEVDAKAEVIEAAEETVDESAITEPEEEEELEFEIDLDEFEIVSADELEAAVEEAVTEEEAAVEVEEVGEITEPIPAEEEASELPETVVDEVDEVDEVEEEDVEVPTEEPVDEALKELLIEADVLAKYELFEKAIEKYEEVIDRMPSHIESHEKLIGLLLDQGAFERTAEVAMLYRGVLEEADEAGQWKPLRKELKKAGFTFEDDQIVAPEPVVEEEPVAAEASAEEAKVVGDAGDLSWLESESTAVTPSQGDAAVFESEDEFFDLASEIERELDHESGTGHDVELVSDEQSIHEIVEGFRKGMAETLSPEDYDTHYNLGIAYREMGLVDEAISEFQLAAKDSRYLIDCCSLLATCFVDKGFPELAIKWYNEGLDSPTITQEEVLGLQYELGDLYLRIGEAEEAKQRFVEIYGVNSDYRDVSSKLESLEQAQ